MSARAAGAGPIHVAHVTNYLPGYHTHAGGAEFATLRTIQHIARAGVQCSVWCLKPDAAAGAGRDEESFELHAVPVVEDWLPPVARRYLEVAKWYAWQGDPLALHRAAQLWRESPPQLVHFHNCQFLSLGLLEQARRRQIPTVLSIYDYWLFCPLTTLTDADGRSCRREHGPGCLPCLPRLLTPVQAAFLARRRALFRRLRERVDRYVVLSEASGQLLTDFGIDPGQIEVIRVPMDLDAFQPEPNAPEGRLVVFAGWIQRRKGLAELLRAMPAVLSRHPDAKLEVLGMPVKWEPDYERQVSELASELGSSVVMRGKLPFAELQQRVREASVVVIPEQWENMSPILLLECLLMGKPVVASRIGGIPEFIEDGQTGYLFDSRNPDDLAAKICTVLDDPAAASTRALDRGPAWARETLEPHTIAAQYAQLYQRLAGSSDASAAAVSGPARTQERPPR